MMCNVNVQYVCMYVFWGPMIFTFFDKLLPHKPKMDPNLILTVLNINSVANISALRTSQLCYKHLSFQNSSTLSQLASISALRTAQLCSNSQASQLSEQLNSAASISALRTAQLCCKHLSY